MFVRKMQRIANPSKYDSREILCYLVNIVLSFLHDSQMVSQAD